MDDCLFDPDPKQNQTMINHTHNKYLVCHCGILPEDEKQEISDEIRDYFCSNLISFEPETPPIIFTNKIKGVIIYVSSNEIISGWKYVLLSYFNDVAIYIKSYRVKGIYPLSFKQCLSLFYRHIVFLTRKKCLKHIRGFLLNSACEKIELPLEYKKFLNIILPGDTLDKEYVIKRYNEEYYNYCSCEPYWIKNNTDKNYPPVFMISYLVKRFSIINKTVLELGCGFGMVSGLFNMFSNRVIALDINEKRTYVIHRYKLNNLFAVCASGEYIPLEDNTVDIIFCRDYTQHVSDLRKTLSDIYRVLKPGGVFISDEINPKETTNNRNFHHISPFRITSLEWYRNERIKLISLHLIDKNELNDIIYATDGFTSKELEKVIDSDFQVDLLNEIRNKHIKNWETCPYRHLNGMYNERLFTPSEIAEYMQKTGFKNIRYKYFYMNKFQKKNTGKFFWKYIYPKYIIYGIK